MSADKPIKCIHEIVKCMCCGLEGTPHQLLSTRPRKVTEKGIEQRREAGKKGGWPKGKPRKPKVTE